MASAPGKTILMGEHAVVYGAPALVAAVDLRARAVVESSGAVPSGHLRVELPDLDHDEVLPRSEVLDHARRSRRRWEQFHRSPGRESFARIRGDGPGDLTLVALGEAMEAAARPDGGTVNGEGVRVEVRSEIPIGRGFGSSAAVGAAVCLAWLAREGIERSRAEMEALLMEVERRQHGEPSGVDAATILRGGLVWAESSPDGSGLLLESISASADFLRGFRIVDTGSPAESTGEVVSAVRERRDREPERIGAALERIREATVAFRRLLGEADPAPGDAVELIRRCERGLEELGVVPEPVRRLVRAVEDRGGAAKISGAGALGSGATGPPGGGLLLVYHPEPEGVRRWPFLEGLDVLDVRLGAPGARVEEVAE